jgi:hypothetical protein
MSGEPIASSKVKIISVIEQTVFESIISFYVKSHFPDFTIYIENKKTVK